MHAIVTFIAKYFIALSVIGICIVWLRLNMSNKKRFIVVAVIGAILTIVLAKLASKLYYDPRPFVAGHFTPYFSHGNDNGFPSDHTLFASFLAFLSWYYSKKAGLGLLIVALLIGLSRVVAGVHHLLDILGSMVFAFVGSWLAFYLVQKIAQKRSADKSVTP